MAIVECRLVGGDVGEQADDFELVQSPASIVAASGGHLQFDDVVLGSESQADRADADDDEHVEHFVDDESYVGEAVDREPGGRAARRGGRSGDPRR